MTQRILKSLLLAAGLMVMATAGIPAARAAITPLSVAIIPPFQFPPSDFTIVGARASVLWGHHYSINGVDVGGLGNFTDHDFNGIAVSGLFNITHGMTTILFLQAAGVTNMSTEKIHVVGLQVAGLYNSHTAESSVLGVQLAALANYSPNTKIMGAQVGLYNKAHDVYGFQIGLLNYADSVHGFQIGLLNFNRTGLFSVAPFLNVGF